MRSARPAVLLVAAILGPACSGCRRPAAPPAPAAPAAASASAGPVTGQARAWLQAGEAEYSRGDAAAAERSFAKAVALAPAAAEAHDWLGSALLAQSVAPLGGDNVDRAKVEQAIASFARAAQLDARQPDYRLRLALARRKLHDLAGARRDLEEAVRLGGRPECRMHLGEVLHESGDLAGARREMEAALAASPRLPRALTGLARLHLTEGRPAPARELLERAVALDPRSPEARFHLSQALRRLGEDEAAAAHEAEFGRLRSASDALHALRQAIAARPRDPQPQQALGQWREAAGDLAGAAEAYARALELDPRFVPARVNLAGLLLDAGRPEAALPHLRAAAEVDPARPEVHVNLGFALEQLGDRPGAAAAYAAALRLAPGDASIRARLERVQLVAQASR